MSAPNEARIKDGFRSLAVLGVWIGFDQLPHLGGIEEGLIGLAEAIASVLIVVIVENFLLSTPCFLASWQLVTQSNERIAISGNYSVPVPSGQDTRWFVFTLEYKELGTVARWIGGAIAKAEHQTRVRVSLSPSTSFQLWAEQATSGLNVERSLEGDQDFICLWEPARLRTGIVGRCRVGILPEVALGPVELNVSLKLKSGSYVRRRVQLKSELTGISFLEGSL